MKFLFNSTMLWAAALGWLIGATTCSFRDIARHKGSAIVTFGDGDRYPEQERELSEEEYKSHSYTNAVFALGFGILFWCFLAKAKRDEERKTQTEKDHLEAQLKRASAYHEAFASYFGPEIRILAETKALSDPAVLDAEKSLSKASVAHLRETLI
jgi:hypothetical protein